MRPENSAAKSPWPKTWPDPRLAAFGEVFIQACLRCETDGINALDVMKKVNKSTPLPGPPRSKISVRR